MLRYGARGCEARKTATRESDNIRLTEARPVLPLEHGRWDCDSTWEDESKEDRQDGQAYDKGDEDTGGKNSDVEETRPGVFQSWMTQYRNWRATQDYLDLADQDCNELPAMLPQHQQSQAQQPAITRILKSLGELGLEHYQAPLVRFFLEETLVQHQLPRVHQSVLGYIMFAIPALTSLHDGL
ncbi:opioid growth factor receptor-like protein [Cricetulus griseus]|nr:opioid growth factor receptor-like protein [Cricetulus griseus]